MLLLKSLSDLKDLLSQVKTPIFYLSNDPLHGVGLETLFPNYHIVCIDDGPVVKAMQKQGVKVFSLEQTRRQQNILFRSSRLLLEQPPVIEYIRAESRGERPAFLFFKPFFDAGTVWRRAGGEGEPLILNTTPLQNWLFENKISFLGLAKAKGVSLASSQIIRLSEMSFDALAAQFDLPFVVQFGRGWAGSTTFVVYNRHEFLALANRFPNRLVKMSEYILGSTLINNACLTQGGLFVSFPFYQITGQSELTANSQTTCGNEWVSSESLKASAPQTFCETEKVARALAKAGYAGFFGLDFLLEEKSGRVLVSENNARLTASVPFYTQLELLDGSIPLLALHVLEFLGIKFALGEEAKRAISSPRRGGQVVLRNTQKEPITVAGRLEAGVYREQTKGNFVMKKAGYRLCDLEDEGDFLILPAENGRRVNPEIEYARIQSRGGVLSKNGQLKKPVQNAVKFIREKLGC